MRTETITAKRFTTAALVAIGAFVASLVLAPSVWAGNYYAWECGGVYGGPNNSPDVQGPFGGAALTAENSCGSGGNYGIVSYDSWNTGGQYQAYDVFAPSGTRFLNGHADVAIANRGNYQGYASIGNGSAHSNHVATETLGTWQGFDWSGQSDTRQFTVWLYCPVICGPGEGAGSGMSYAYARNLTFQVNDFTTPGVSIGGDLTGGGWRNSGGSLNVSGTDSGGGVYVLDQYINGNHVGQTLSSCSLATLFGGTVGDRLTPCPTSNSRSTTFGTGSFQQGSNTYQGCVRDFATDGNYNQNCSSTSVAIDTVAPESVSGMTVSGGEAWRPTNDFDVSWSNPAQAHAPIDGAMYRISRVGGGYDSGAQFVSGSNRQSLSDLQVPSPGEYTLKVWTRDAATNNSEATARTATLRFDPTIPPEAEAEYNGWIRRNDFQYEARWDQVPPGLLGPSGLDGYAARVTQSPDSDPCVTAAHPASSCSSAEINNDGITENTMPVAAAEVSEGQWYIHVVPVTGAGVKASSIEHTAMPVDETDPETAISGTPDGWVNHDVTVSASASDALSGMAPNGSQFSVDPQPRTCLQVGVGSADCEPDDTISRVISNEGAHEVRYFARDLAGNENNGQADAEFPSKLNNPANVASVQIDKSGPQLAFSARTVEDPSHVFVSASDPLSGVVDGAIELRRQGSTSDWLALDTSVTGDSLSGHVPDDIDPGRYEFRATATDEAGNTNSTSSRADGSAMVEELPLKEAVNLTAEVAGAEAKPDKGKGGKGKGKCKKAGRGKGKGGKCKKAAPAATVTVPYGQPVELRGYLQTTADAPLRGRELTVTEHLAEGATPTERTQSVVTDQGGAYAVNLQAGPSRRVTVRYEGDTRYRPTTTNPVDVAVRSKVLSFKSPRTVPETRAIRFSGKIGALGVDLGAAGKRIELQYEKSKRHWKTIDSGEATGTGEFKLRYGLRANYVQRTKVRFRVMVPADRAWPYSGSATSKARKTVILP